MQYFQYDVFSYFIYFIQLLFQVIKTYFFLNKIWLNSYN